MRRAHPVTVVFTIVVTAVALSACSGDDDVASVDTFPPGLDACQAVTGPDTAETCLDAIERQLAIDTLASAAGEPVDDGDFSIAVAPIAESFRLLGAGSSFDRQPPVGDEPATTPIRTLWRITTAERVLWTCFDDVEVTISTSEC